MLSYWEYVLGQAAALVILASGLNLQIGYIGIYFAAPAALAFIGALVGGLVAIHVSASIVVVSAAAVGAGVVCSALFGLIASRVPGEYFIVVSLAIGFVIIGVASQLSFLGGDLGLIGIPATNFFGMAIDDNLGYAVAGIVMTISAVCLFAGVAHSRVGRRWRAVMDDERAARSVGLHPLRLRVGASAVSGIFYGLAGAIYVAQVQYVSTTDFGANLSFLAIVGLVLGGAGTVAGPIVGGLLVEAAYGGLGLVGFSAQYAGVVPQILYGLILVGVLTVAPGGLLRVGPRGRAQGDIGRVRRRNGRGGELSEEDVGLRSGTAS
jgi:ABC-type branched-subunit amino acid transport system permease subunit